MPRIFFFTSTNFHFFVAVDLIQQKYNLHNGYEPRVVQLNRASKRILTSIDIDAIDDLFQLEEVTYNEFTLDKGNLTPWVSRNQYRSGDTIVVFLEQGFFSVWANYFRPKGVKLCLAPDGNKPYYKVTNSAFPSRARATITIYRFLLKFGYKLLQPYFQSLNYGRLSNLDEIWVRYPQKYVGEQKEKIKPFTLFKDFSAAHPLNRIYKVDESKDFAENEGFILYVNNILYEQVLYDEEIKVLRSLKDNYHDRSIYIKYHPSTPVAQLKQFEEIEGVVLVSNPIPVELFIQSLQNCVIISMWSAGLMIDNPSCNFYWLNRYLEKKGIMLERIQLTNPTPHIKEVELLDDISFPKEK